MASLATGFALSVLPVSAETITTDSNGLVAGEVKIPVQGGDIPAYRAMPARVDPQLLGLFHSVPRMHYAVRAMTPAEAASSTAAKADSVILSMEPSSGYDGGAA